MKILLPVDGPPGSDRAAGHVVSMSRTCAPLSVQVLHVQAPVLYIELLANPSPEVLSHWTGRIGREMSHSACGLLDAAGVSHALEIVEGEPGETIARRAREGGFDLIVMGTRGRGGIVGLLLGSVATRVAQIADCPVTLVR